MAACRLAAMIRRYPHRDARQGLPDQVSVILSERHFVWSFGWPRAELIGVNSSGDTWRSICRPIHVAVSLISRNGAWHHLFKRTYRHFWARIRARTSTQMSDVLKRFRTFIKRELARQLNWGHDLGRDRRNPYCDHPKAMHREALLTSSINETRCLFHWIFASFSWKRLGRSRMVIDTILHHSMSPAPRESNVRPIEKRSSQSCGSDASRCHDGILWRRSRRSKCCHRVGVCHLSAI